MAGKLSFGYVSDVAETLKSWVPKLRNIVARLISVEDQIRLPLTGISVDEDGTIILGTGRVADGAYLQLEPNNQNGLAYLVSGDTSGAVVGLFGAGTNGSITLQINNIEQLGFDASSGDVQGAMFDLTSWDPTYGGAAPLTWPDAGVTSHFVKSLQWGNLWMYSLRASGVIGGGTGAALTFTTPSGVTLGSPGTKHTIGWGYGIDNGVDFTAKVTAATSGIINVQKVGGGTFLGGAGGVVEVNIFGIAETV